MRDREREGGGLGLEAGGQLRLRRLGPAPRISSRGITAVPGPAARGTGSGPSPSPRSSLDVRTPRPAGGRNRGRARRAGRARADHPPWRSGATGLVSASFTRMKTRYILPVIVFALWFAAVPAVLERRPAQGQRPRRAPRQVGDQAAQEEERQARQAEGAAEEPGQARRQAQAPRRLRRGGCGHRRRSVHGRHLQRPRRVVAAFAGAPLTNPDGTTGSTSTSTPGSSVPPVTTRSGARRRSRRRSPAPAPTTAVQLDRGEPLRGLPPGGARQQPVRARRVATPPTSCSSEPASDFGYVAMHELGHIFGLDHGNVNSFSVMSGGISGRPEETVAPRLQPLPRRVPQRVLALGGQRPAKHSRGRGAPCEVLRPLLLPQPSRGCSRRAPRTPTST